MAGSRNIRLFDALPAANILALVGLVGFRRSLAFTLGFVIAGSLSLVAYQVWSRSDPWAWLRLVEPPFKVISQIAEQRFTKCTVGDRVCDLHRRLRYPSCALRSRRRVPDGEGLGGRGPSRRGMKSSFSCGKEGLLPALRQTAA